MDSIPIKPERQAELDDAIASYPAWQKQDFEEAIEGIRRGYEDVKAGRTRPAAEIFADLRRKHGSPG